MLIGVFQRAVMAILLMGALLAPSGICLRQTQKAAHDCCAPASKAIPAVQNDCCTARSTLPAFVAAPDLPAPEPLALPQDFVSAQEPESPSALPVSAIVLPHSPPSGAFSLRI
jgi:hypothetical protein